MSPWQPRSFFCCIIMCSGAHIGAIGFFCLSDSRAELLSYSSQPNPLAADGNNKAMQTGCVLAGLSCGQNFHRLFTFFHMVTYWAAQEVLRGSVTHLGSFHCQPLENLLICLQLICLYIYLILISGHTLSAVRNLHIIHRAGDPLFSNKRLDLCSKRYLTDVSYTSGLLVGDKKVWDSHPEDPDTMMFGWFAV